MNNIRNLKYNIPKLRVVNPLYPFVNKLKFNDYYRIIIDYRFRLNERTAKKTFLGDPKRKQCCICNKKETEASFRTKKHIIPASFGNKWLLSFEECDGCNEKLGKKLENELAAMFLPQRVMCRIPKRNGYPKIQIGQKSSYMLGGATKLSISLIDGENDFEVKHLENNELSITVPALPFYPINAIKSIAHSLWLLLDKQKRRKYYDILSWIKGEIEIIPFIFHEGFIPGPDDGTLSITVWEKSKENCDLADLIIKFHFSNTFIIWELPNFKTGEYLPSVLPEFNISKFPPYEPKLNMITVSTEEQIRPKKFNFTMHYERLEEAGSNTVEQQKSKPIELTNHVFNSEYNNSEKLPFLVNLVAIKDKVKSEIPYAFLICKKETINNFKLTISGGHLACDIEIDITKDNNTNILFKPRFDKSAIPVAKNTFSFIKIIFSGCKLMIKNLHNKSLDSSLDIPPATKQLDEDIFIVMDYLETINVSFKTDIRFSYDFTPKELQDIIYLANGIKYGSFRSEVNHFQIRVRSDDVKKIKSLMNTKSKALSIQINQRYIIKNVEFDAGLVKIQVTNPTIVQPIDSKHEYTDIDIMGDAIVFNFEKYLVKTNDDNS